MSDEYEEFNAENSPLSHDQLTVWNEFKKGKKLPPEKLDNLLRTFNFNVHDCMNTFTYLTDSLKDDNSMLSDGLSSVVKAIDERVSFAKEITIQHEQHIATWLSSKHSSGKTTIQENIAWLVACNDGFEVTEWDNVSEYMSGHQKGLILNDAVNLISIYSYMQGLTALCTANAFNVFQPFYTEYRKKHGLPPLPELEEPKTH